MNRLVLAASLLAATSALAARQAREVGSFDALDVRGGLHAHVAQGAASVELNGEDDELKEVDVHVEGGTLVVQPRRDHGSFDSGELRIEVRATALHALQASGGGSIDSDGVPGLEQVEASGGGAVRARGVNAGDLAVELSGGARATLEGKAERLSLDVSGGGRARLAKLDVREARISQSGGAWSELSASEKVRGSLSGGATARVRGRAQVQVSTSGGADLEHD